MIPVNEPVIGEREIEYVMDCLRTGWISSAGTYIERFEREWAAYCGRRFGVAMCNGSVALQAAVAALKLKPGDEVIMPTFTIISCAFAIVYNGGVPVLVDSDPRTWCMDVDQIEDKITPQTRAIMPVHIYGHPVDMDPVMKLAQEHDLAVIEDAAEAHGAEYLTGRDTSHPTWKRCGSFGDMSCFSFYANKLITTGEGGMVLTDNPDIAERLRSLRNLSFQPQRRFYHEDLGFNFRLTNIQAAIGLAQLERIDQIIAHKRWMGQEYTKRLQDIKCLQLPVEKAWAKNVYWMYGIVLSREAGLDAFHLAEILFKKGIETRPFFLGMHRQPVFNYDMRPKESRFPISEVLGLQGLYLPSGLTLNMDHLGKICDIVHEVLI
ncbi:MAG: DegT/DnrJ/EryC1/StrS family aminotransferase [Methanothrix sp.]